MGKRLSCLFIILMIMATKCGTGHGLPQSQSNHQNSHQNQHHGKCDISVHEIATPLPLHHSLLTHPLQQQLPHRMLIQSNGHVPCHTPHSPHTLHTHTQSPTHSWIRIRSLLASSTMSRIRPAGRLCWPVRCAIWVKIK